MKQEIVTVFYNNQPLMLHKVIADRFGVKAGYVIKTEDEFWKIFNANAEYQLLKCKVALNQN